MIITKTPFRISFVGGGSDLEDFYSRHQGAVLATSINKYMYISTHKFFEEDKFRIKYSQSETVSKVDDIKHPIVREALKKFNTLGGLEISSNADVPAGTGLGSSSAFTVGLLHNLYTLAGKFVTKKQLAEEACDMEINRLKEPIGKQDQYAAAFGGMNIFKFNPDGSVDVEPLHIKKTTLNLLEKHLMMFYTGEQRQASSILTEMKQNLKSEEKHEILKKMVGLVWEMRDSLYADDLLSFGKILHKNWLLKQKLASGISNPYLNEIYKKALANGVVGGKILGAGGSGFMLFYCEPENQDRLRTALSGLKEMAFGFDKEGTKLIYAQDEEQDYLYFNKVIDTISNKDKDMIHQAADLLLQTYHKDGTIYIFGNGGSGGTASHFAGDINKGISYGLEKRFKAICLNDNMPSLMAIANDLSYDDIFVEPLRNFLKKDDLVIGFSGSGNSANVVKALTYAKEVGAKTIAYCGYDGGKIKALADVPIHANINDMEIAEDYHLIVSHSIKRMLMDKLQNMNNTKTPNIPPFVANNPTRPDLK